MIIIVFYKITIGYKRHPYLSFNCIYAFSKEESEWEILLFIS